MSSAWLPQHVISLFHLINYLFLGVFAYCYTTVLRPEALATEVGQKRLLEAGYTGYPQEQEVCGIVLLVFLWKLHRCRGADEVLHRLLQHAKILCIVLSFLSGSRLALLSTLGIYFGMAVLLVPPKYHGESKVYPLSSDDFDSRIRKSYDANLSHVVLCYTPWNNECYFFEPVFVKLSAEYTSKELQFNSIDLEKHPELANELEIDMTSRSKQLPTILLFFRGQEIRRLPSFKDDGKVAKAPLNKKSVTAFFELDVDPKVATYRKNAKPIKSKTNKKKK